LYNISLNICNVYCRGASAIVPLRKVSNPASSSVDDSSDIDSNISLGEFGDDPEIMEKVK